jgi:hypothetical protein
MRAPAEIGQQVLLLHFGQLDVGVDLANTVGLVEAAEVAVFEHVRHHQDDVLVDVFGLLQVFADRLEAEQDLAARNVRAGLAHDPGERLAETLVQQRRLAFEAVVQLACRHHRHIAQHRLVEGLFQLCGVLQARVVPVQVGAERVQAQLVARLQEALDVPCAVRCRSVVKGVVWSTTTVSRRPEGRCGTRRPGLGVAAWQVIALGRHQGARRRIRQAAGA